MPGLPKQRPIKGRNKGPGTKRFVFKSFGQRVEEIDVDVFRSLTPLKLGPNEGTSFFHESLVTWRELNSAAEFTSAYEKLLPVVQTLPQLILHKEFVIDTLISLLQLSAIHSLEPIFSLIAVLSRDLQSDFTAFIPQICGAFVDLLQSGGDREPQIIEKMFSSLSYIFKFLQKNLCKGIKFILKATRGLRYYRRLYIQDFAAEAVSYLLRSSSHEQLIRGIRRLLYEVHLKPSKENISSCSSLLCYTLKGPGKTLHSRANSVLRLLVDKSTFKSTRKKDTVGQVIVDVLSNVVDRLCQDLDGNELLPVWSCLLDEINSCLDKMALKPSEENGFVKEGDSFITMGIKCSDMDEKLEGTDSAATRGCFQLETEEKNFIANLITLLNQLLVFRKGSRIHDFQPLFSLSFRLLRPCLLICGEKIIDGPHATFFFDAEHAEAIHFNHEVWKFVLNLIKIYTEVSGLSTMPSDFLPFTTLWNQLWKCLDFQSMLYIVQELLKHGDSIIHLFMPNILRLLDTHINTQSRQILPLAVQIFEKMERVVSSSSENSQLEGLLSFVASRIKDATANCLDCTNVMQQREAALVWAALNCYSHLVKFDEHEELLIRNFIIALDHRLRTTIGTNGNIEDHKDYKLWGFVLATGLSTELNIFSYTAFRSLQSRACEFLELAVRHKSSPHVLRTVADFLDAFFRESADVKEIIPVELHESLTLSLLENNLGSQSKILRLATLRLLIHLDKATDDGSVVAKRRKHLDGSFSKESSLSSDAVFEQLLSIESSPFSLDAGRQCTLVLTQLKVLVCTRSLSDYYLTSLTHAMIGILSNRFGLLWDAAVDCLSGLLDTQKKVVWERFTQHLDYFQNQFLCRKAAHLNEVANDDTDECLVLLMEAFQQNGVESREVGHIIISMLKAAQKVPSVSEGHTRLLVPAFLTFVGHNSENNSDLVDGSHFSSSCRTGNNNYGGKDWDLVLKEWLTLLSFMKNAKSYFRSTTVKKILIDRFLTDRDPEIQMKALECLLNWKDNHLITYEDHLKNLIMPKSAREEMTTWNIGTESDCVQANHRDELVSILLRILFPKILKAKSRLHNKTAGSIQRKVVLGFLVSLEVHELPLFFILILKPLEGAITETGMMLVHEDCAWELAIKQGAYHEFIEWVDIEGIVELSHKKKIGFLHMLKDILETFDQDHLAPYLHACLAFTFRILEASNVDIESGASPKLSTSPNQILSGRKDIRTLSLRVIAIVLSKYEATVFTTSYWDIFFSTIRPLVLRFADEAASGDGPNALLLCLLAMSRRLAFVSILQKEEDIVPNMLPLLSHKNASVSVVGAALSFIENVLALEEEDTGLVMRFVLVHLPLLLSNLSGLLSLQPNGMRKFSLALKRGLHILLKLGRHICNAKDADHLLDILLPLVHKQKKISQEELLHVLHVLKELGPSLSKGSSEKALPFLGQHLSSSSDLDVRSTICQVLLAFASGNSTLSFVAGVVSDLNSLSPTTIGEYDYDRRIQAYSHVTVDSLSQLSYEHALLVISQCFFDVESDDISIRHSSSNCLSTFVCFLALQYRSSQDIIESGEVALEETNCLNSKMVDANLNQGSLAGSWDLQAVKVAIQKLLLPQIRKSMSLDLLTARREWVSLLREMVWNLSEFKPLGELLPLVNADPEIDFFNNINHIQTHRRIRAMSKFKEACCAGTFSQGTLVRIFEPLFRKSLFEAKGDKDGNLVQSAIEAIASIAGQLQWDPYYSLLLRLFHIISSRPEHEKVIVRLVCSVLDKFHFENPSMFLESSQKGINFDGKEGKSSITEMDAMMIPEEVAKQIKLHILPRLTKLMFSKEKAISVPVSLAVVKVLQLMPHDVMELELPRIIQSIVNLLKNRSHVVRDEARAGLGAVVGCLGAGYFGFVLEKLCNSLQRGYELHVLGFTLNALISRIFPNLKVGEIDYCADKILNVLANDIFEDVADEKEVEKMASKMKEIKRSGSYESLKLVAQLLTFHVHGSTLLQAIMRRLKDAMIPKTKEKIERALRHLALGIQLNSSLQVDMLLTYVYGLVKEGIAAENSKNSEDSKEKVPNSHLITEFALQLLESHLKKAKINRNDLSLMSMLDPMVVLLQDCLESRHQAVVRLALKSLCHLMRLPLPSVEVSGPALFEKVLIMTQGLAKFENQDAQPCFNFLVTLLNNVNASHISEDQLHTILHFPVFADLEKAETNTGLVILKAIVGRKLLVPELYDILKTVFQLLVKSHVAAVRQYSSEVALQFLLDYPLGSRRLQQHLDFLIANLSFEHASGREAVLEMLHAIIVKFPAQAVDEQLDTFFLPLVTRLVNDESNQVRSMVGTVLKVLMGRVSDRSLQRMLQFCLSWLKGDKQQLWRAASQVLGLAVEIMGAKYHVHLEESLDSSLRILNVVLEVNGVSKKAINTTSGILLWQEAYYILATFEKLLKQFPEVSFWRSEELWETIICFLIHKHAWVRKSSSRFLGLYFTTCCAAKKTGEDDNLIKADEKTFLSHPSSLMQLTAILCQQLSSELDEQLAGLIKTNLLFIVGRLHCTSFQGKAGLSWMDIASGEGVSSQFKVAAALNMLKVPFISKESGSAVHISEKKESLVKDPDGHRSEDKYFGLHPVFGYLQRVSLQGDHMQIKTVFHVYEGLLACLGKEGVQPYLSSVLLPLYRTVQAVSAMVVTADSKIQAESVLNQIRETVGTEKFVTAYNETRQMVENIRQTRKSATKVRALLDPEGHARKKLKLHAKHQIQKKKRRKLLHDGHG